MNLRDHEQPCDCIDEQGDAWALRWGTDPWLCGADGCPGGAAVVIDYEAAGAAWRRHEGLGCCDDSSARCVPVIVAALGLTDD